MVELDKSQKKIARTLISRALERECCTFLAKLKRFLQDEKRSPAMRNIWKYIWKTR